MTSEKPASSIFDLAWPSVKLLAPATGLSELFWPELLTALLFGRSAGGGFCADNGLARSASLPPRRRVGLGAEPVVPAEERAELEPARALDQARRGGWGCWIGRRRHFSGGR